MRVYVRALPPASTDAGDQQVGTPLPFLCRDTDNRNENKNKICRSPDAGTQNANKNWEIRQNWLS